ncbi:MAG: hypothetical protein GWN84_13200 [Gammaproteobacteria bacterium]|nr:hypothetical protein [Gammaproteobacteria bacterium]NIR83786.1 hypothetical protein [Gammaproteobacteria bacterium]NIU05112.1 hypothetical protein [Gammaproteobacteria bacterium]NIV51949.1 hypothetical protein [Gammaproteobacteria bacterium]NIX86385.1 hypothetical protein [Gammaproteobacteria bacterium]
MLVALVVDVFGEASYPVVRHVFPARACAEATASFKAHIEACSFLSSVLASGNDTRVRAHWEVLQGFAARVVEPARIRGGRAARFRPEDFHPYWLAVGTCVELEHTGSLSLAMRIAMDHLVEDRLYYEKLEAAGL